MRTDLPSLRRRGLSLVEMMVVALIVMVFTASAATVFIQIIQTSDAVDAKIEAVKNGRFLLDTLTEDLSQALIANGIPAFELFKGVDAPLTFGDLVDNDRDNQVDEEAADGLDNDTDWGIITDDHDFQRNDPTFGALAERGWQEADLGDAHVDEDVVFQNDEIIFWIRGPQGGNVLRQNVTYRIEPFEGEDNVAVRRVRTVFNDGSPDTEEVGPLAFGAVSLSFHYWDHRQSPPRWVTQWDSGSVTNSPRTPVSVHAEITVHSDSTRLRLPPTRALSVERLATIINLETALRSPGFPRGLGRLANEPSPLNTPAASDDRLDAPAGRTGAPAPAPEDARPIDG